MINVLTNIKDRKGSCDLNVPSLKVSLKSQIKSRPDAIIIAAKTFLQVHVRTLLTQHNEFYTIFTYFILHTALTFACAQGCTLQLSIKTFAPFYATFLTFTAD